MSSKGFLPKKVAYVCASKAKIDVYDDDDYQSKKIATYQVHPTFPVEDGKKLDTAISWTGLKRPTIDVLNNEPLTNVRVCDLDYRGNGGRAYKVIINDKYYVDMREDVILDTMITNGIEVGGILKGTYVWAKYGAQMKLVRVGSYAHKMYSSNEDPSDLVEIKSSDVKVGGIYDMKSGTRKMYLGSFYTYDYSATRMGGYFYSGTAFTDEKLTRKKVHVFVEIWEWYVKNINTATPMSILDQKGNSHMVGSYDIKSSIPKFVKEICVKDLTGIVIEDVIRELAEQYDKDNNPYPINWHVDKLCLGKTEPYMHPKVSKLNLPIEKKS
jgi:hypothetical protein